MKELKTISNINLNGVKIKAVSARELHEKLEVKAKFKGWIKARLKEVMAYENVDYIKAEQTTISTDYPNLSSRKIEYILPLDLAKEIAMLEHNKKGKMIRRHFLKMENSFSQLVPKDYVSDEAELKQKALKTEPDLDQEYATINRVAKSLNKEPKYFSWRLLNIISEKLRLNTKIVEDEIYGEIKSYHAIAWIKAYNIDITKI